MSHASVKSKLNQQPSLEELIAFGFNFLGKVIDESRTIVQHASSLLPPMPDLRSLRPKEMCEIPEVDCPPRCVCEVTWEASPSEKLALRIRVINASKSARTFQLEATPFVGEGSPGTIAIAPKSLSLPAGHSGIANATFAVPDVPEGAYEAEILVRGAYEQCIRVGLRVKCEKTCGDSVCTCEVVQGEPPVRIRAHHWYDHFQCTEPCLEQRHLAREESMAHE